MIDHLADLLPERAGSPLSVSALREDIGVAFDTGRAPYSVDGVIVAPAAGFLALI